MSTFVMPAFNPLRFANRLKAAGVPEKQAEAEAEVLHEVLAQQTQAMSDLESQFKKLSTEAKRDAEHMATKGDIALLKEDIALLKEDIALLKGDIALLKGDMVLLEAKLEAKIVIARRDTIIWLGGISIAGFGTVISILFKLMG